MPTFKHEIDLASPVAPVTTIGLADAEPIGRWTRAEIAEISLALPETRQSCLMLTLEIRPFLVRNILSSQRVIVRVGDVQLADWVLTNEQCRKRSVILDRSVIGTCARLALTLELPDCAQPSSLNINSDERRLGILIRRIELAGLDHLPAPTDIFAQLGRPVGREAAKSFDQRVESGFWARFVEGPRVLDVGFRGSGGDVVPIVEGAVGIDLDYPGYDGRTLPFPDESQDAVFSSHCLEHIPSYINAIQDWFRVTRVGGHIITIVPSAFLYERRRRPPSRWNRDHQRFYTPASLLAEFESALRPNSYRVRFVEENDEGYRYDDPAETHPFGCYEIVLVVQKIAPPTWGLDL